MKLYWQPKIGQQIFRQETKVKKTWRRFFLPFVFLNLGLLIFGDLIYFFLWSVWLKKKWLKKTLKSPKNLVLIKYQQTHKKAKKPSFWPKKISFFSQGNEAWVFLALVFLILAQLPLLLVNIRTRSIEKETVDLKVERKVEILALPTEINAQTRTLVKRPESYWRTQNLYTKTESFFAENFSQAEKVNLALAHFYLNDWQNYHFWLNEAKKMDPNEIFFN